MGGSLVSYLFALERMMVEDGLFSWKIEMR